MMYGIWLDRTVVLRHFDALFPKEATL